MKKLLTSTIILLGFSSIGFSQAAAQDSLETSKSYLTGTVVSYDANTGVGRIKADQILIEVFLENTHASQPLWEGDKVSYDIEDTPRGPVAVNVNKQ